MLIFWIIFSIVVPNIGWLIAKKVMSVPSISQLNELQQQKEHEIYLSGKYSRYWESNWIGKPPNMILLKRVAGSNEETKLHNDIWRGYRNTIITQTNVAINLSKISPFSVFRFLGEKISDNGFSGYVHFYQQARNYQNSYQDFINQKDQADKESYHLIWDENKWMIKSFMSTKPVNFDEIPQFEYKRPSFGRTLDNCKWDILILVLWNLVLFAGTFVAFVRYDVR